MNLVRRGSSKLIDDNRRWQDRTILLYVLYPIHAYTHAPPELGYVNSIDARKKRTFAVYGWGKIDREWRRPFAFFFFPLSLFYSVVCSSENFFTDVLMFCFFFAYLQIFLYICCCRREIRIIPISMHGNIEHVRSRSSSTRKYRSRTMESCKWTWWCLMTKNSLSSFSLEYQDWWWRLWSDLWSRWSC